MAGTLPSSTDRVLTIAALAEQPALVHGFSTLALGSMHRDASAPSGRTPSRAAFAATLGLDEVRVTVAGAVHGTRVARVDEPSGALAGFDALVTNRPRLPLLATFADCYPVLLFDPVRRALGLAHAGWRGAAAGVVTAALGALQSAYGSRGQDLVVGLGPGICGNCYEVGPEVADRFAPDCLRPAPAGRFLLDLPTALRTELVQAGVPPASVHVHGACTREAAELPSHRRSPDGARFACLAAIA